MSTVLGLSHVALNTPDLDRFHSFYCDVLGLQHLVTVEMNHPPHLRHAAFEVAVGTVLHVFEVPGYDPVADGFGTEIGERGRIDHFGFMVADWAALEELRDRLVAVGAADGQINQLGPVWPVHFRDPDGLACEVNLPVAGFDPFENERDSVVETGDPSWVDRVGGTASVPA